jgi:cytoskeletal protein CcmA (bactofilin family)
MKKQLITTLIASTFSLAANAAGINFDGKNVENCIFDGILSTYYCNGLQSNDSHDIYIASGFTVDMDSSVLISVPSYDTTDKSDGTLNAASAILGANAKLEGNLNSATTVALGAGADIQGNVTSGTTVALGAGATMTGRSNNVSGETWAILAGSTLALGAEAIVTGDVKAETTIAVGADGQVDGNVTAGTTVALGANATVGQLDDDGKPTGDSRNVTAGTTVALGADAIVTGNVESTSSSIAVGVKGEIHGYTKAASSATLSADAFSCGNISGTTATLGAGAFADSEIDVVTATLGANSYVSDKLTATTATLGAGACYGSKVTGLIPTLGAGAGQCGVDTPPLAANDC